MFFARQGISLFYYIYTNLKKRWEIIFGPFSISIDSVEGWEQCTINVIHLSSFIDQIWHQRALLGVSESRSRHVKLLFPSFRYFLLLLSAPFCLGRDTFNQMCRDAHDVWHERNLKIKKTTGGNFLIFEMIFIIWGIKRADGRCCSIFELEQERRTKSLSCVWYAYIFWWMHLIRRLIPPVFTSGISQSVGVHPPCLL
jgi:hypothetical protein